MGKFVAIRIMVNKKWLMVSAMVLIALGSITLIVQPQEFSIVLNDGSIKAKYSEGILKAYSGKYLAFEDYLNIYYWNGKGYTTMYRARGTKFSNLSYYKEGDTTYLKQTIYYSKGNLTRHFKITEYQIKESFDWSPKDENLRVYFLWTYGNLDKWKEKYVYLDKNKKEREAVMDFEITNNWEREINNLVRVERFKNGKLKLRTKVFQGNASFDPEIVLQKPLKDTFKELKEGEIKSTRNLKYISKIANEKVLIEKSKPEMKLEKWGNETFVKISRKNVSYSQGSLVNDTNLPIFGKRLSDSKVKFTNHKEEVHIYSLEKGMEYEVILKEKPESNKIEMEIESQDLNFYYQPPLNQEKQEKGLTCNETDCWDENGTNIVHRPINVVGSYAVYHESKSGDYSKMGGKNYMVGKAFHIYRPKIIDSKGNWIWGELSIDEKKGILTIEIDQNFLDNAIYPVNVDPTFGYETIGSSYQDIHNYIYGSKFLGASGTIDSVSAVCRAYSYKVKYKVGVYLHSDSSKVCESSVEMPTGWSDYKFHTFNITGSPSISAVDYVLVVGGKDYNDYYRAWTKYDSGDTNQGHYKDITFPTFPDPASFTHNNNKFSIYCTYTAGGGDTTPPTSNHPSDASYTQNSAQTIGWILQDETSPGYYYVKRNGTIQNSSTSWTNNTNLNIWVNTSTVGDNWNYTIYFNDSAGNEGTPDTVFINITSAGGDTCSCPGLNNNWEIDLSDNCNITSDCNLGTGKLNFTGSGNCYCNATINTTNMSPPPDSSGTLWIQSNCIISIS